MIFSILVVIFYAGNCISGYSIKNCENNEWQCNSSGCIAFSSLCDGKIDCSNGEDELEGNCFNHCSRGAYICDNGSCADGAISCDGIRDCDDGSDEDLSRCISDWKKICTLPKLPVDSSCSYDNLQSKEIFMENEQIILKCMTGYKWIETISYQCMDGEWLLPITVYNEKDGSCNIIKSETTNIYCLYGNTNVSCNAPIKAGTLVHIKCLDGYEKVGDSYPDVIECDKYNKWSFPIYKCQPICGKVQKESIANANSFPWHTNIYVKTTPEDKYKYICGGTIINARIIVSAAHCFWNEWEDKFNEPYMYLVDCGKDKQKNSEYVDYQSQYLEISFYARHKDYDEEFYQHDIIFLILKKSIRFEAHILPICLNSVQYGLDKVIILSDEVGLITSRVNDGSSKTRRTFKKIPLPIISREKCQVELPDEYLNFLTDDKFCAGYSKPRSSVCVGDSGSAIIVKQLVKRNVERYFLMGIVSNGFLPYDDCNNATYTLFTSFQYYLNRAYVNQVFY